MIKYFPFKTVNGNCIKVVVYYSLGGYKARGIWLSLSPVEKSEHQECYRALSDMVCLENLKRKSAKKLADWERRISKVAEPMAKAYADSNYDKVRELIKNA